MQDNCKLLNFYSFFTKYSLMEDYGFTSGLFSRLWQKVLPIIPEKNTIEYNLLDPTCSVEEVIQLLNFNTIVSSEIENELDLSIKVLTAKVIAFGLDSKIKSYFDYLNADITPFIVLLEKVNNFHLVESVDLAEVRTALEKTKFLILFLRKNKSKIGTTLHLTVTTRRILEYITRIEELVYLKSNIASEICWKEYFYKYIDYSKRQYSVRRFVARHIDLMALEIVEHNANKGECYIADNKQQYWSFFRRSLLGGSIISVFAFIKISIDSLQLSQLENAFYYSLNYAICFVLVKQFGGIIATKQPAVTPRRSMNVCLSRPALGGQSSQL